MLVALIFFEPIVPSISFHNYLLMLLAFTNHIQIIVNFSNFNLYDKYTTYNPVKSMIKLKIPPNPHYSMMIFLNVV